MNKITETVDAKSLIEFNYREHGAYVNSTRANVGLDGLKSVQRRVLLALRDVDKASLKKIGSTEVISRCLNNYHPHGDSSIYDTLVRLVQKGFVIGKSNFGSVDVFEDVVPAAYRYTYVKSHKEFSEGSFRFIDLVPTYENEYGKTEPKFLPIPIPLALTTGSKGIGFGLLASIPAFSANSLFDALMADDPSKLKAPVGLFITSGSLDKLWMRGEGWIQYGLKCYTQWAELDGKQVSVIEGPGRLFKPNVKNIFKQYLDDECVYIRDESSSVIRLVISRVKNIKRINDELVHQLAQRAAVHQQFYKVYITKEGKAYRYNIRDWMQELWLEYNKIVDHYKKDTIKVINDKIEILKLIPLVGPHILNNKSTREIAKLVKAPVNSIKEVEGKPIRTLRKDNFDAEIKSLSDEANVIKAINAKSLARDFVNVIDKSQSPS